MAALLEAGMAGCAERTDVRSGHSRSGGIPSLAPMAASIRRDRRSPWLTAVTVVFATPSSRAMSASELPHRRSCILIHSC